jgi:hypothetical protein
VNTPACTIRQVPEFFSKSGALWSHNITFANIKAKIAKTAQKTKNVLYQGVLEFTSESKDVLLCSVLSKKPKSLHQCTLVRIH